MEGSSGISTPLNCATSARLRSLEPLLTPQEFLCAGRFTAADVSVGYALLLARHLGLRGSQVSLHSGETSRDKWFRVDGIPLDEVRRKLAWFKHP